MFLILGKKPGIFDVIIVNDNLEDAYDQLKNALLEVSKEVLRILYYLEYTYQYSYTHHFYMHDNTFLKPKDQPAQLPCKSHLQPFQIYYFQITNLIRRQPHI